MRISPASSSISPATRLSVVVLPQPEGPTSATNSPSATVSERRSTAWCRPYVLTTSVSFTSAIERPAASDQLRSRLDRALGQCLDEPPLEDEEEHDDRDAHDEGGRHEPRPVAHELGEEALEADR